MKRINKVCRLFHKGTSVGKMKQSLSRCVSEYGSGIRWNKSTDSADDRVMLKARLSPATSPIRKYSFASITKRKLTFGGHAASVHPMLRGIDFSCSLRAKAHKTWLKARKSWQY